MIRPFFLVMFSLLSGLLRAQPDVNVSLPSNKFLLYEGIPLRIQITNNDDQPLHIGGREAGAMLRISMRDTRNRVIPRTETALLPEAWVIPPGGTDTREFDLVQLFMLRVSDSYRCVTLLELPDEDLSTKPMNFDLTNGSVIETIRRNRNNRVFTLIGINRNGRDELMLRVSSSDENTHYATYFLEKHLRFFPPEMLADKKGNIATFQYESPNRGVLCRFEPDGKPIGREYYRLSPGMPAKMTVHPELGFGVSGAERMEIIERDSGE